MVKKHGPVLDPDPAKSMILFFLKCEYPAWFLHKKHGKIHHAIKFGKVLFRLGPWLNHGKLSAITRGYPDQDSYGMDHTPEDESPFFPLSGDHPVVIPFPISHSAMLSNAEKS